MTDQDPVQNSVICNEEQTERMNNVIKQVHVMIQSTSKEDQSMNKVIRKENRNNIEDAVGLGKRGKDIDDEEHRSNCDDNVEYEDSGDDSDDDSQYSKSIVSLLGCHQHHNSDMDNTSHDDTILRGGIHWDANRFSSGDNSHMQHPWDESIQNGINLTNDENNSTDTSNEVNMFINEFRHNPSQNNEDCLNGFHNANYRAFMSSLGEQNDIDGHNFKGIFNDRNGNVVIE
jgi:hypothetical protein